MMTDEQAALLLRHCRAVVESNATLADGLIGIERQLATLRQEQADFFDRAENYIYWFDQFASWLRLQVPDFEVFFKPNGEHASKFAD